MVVSLLEEVSMGRRGDVREWMGDGSGKYRFGVIIRFDIHLIIFSLPNIYTSFHYRFYSYISNNRIFHFYIHCFPSKALVLVPLSKYFPFNP